MRLIDVARALLRRPGASDQPTAASTSPRPALTLPARGSKEAEPVTFFAGSDASCAAVGSFPVAVTEAEARELAFALTTAAAHGAPELYPLLLEVAARPLAVLQLVASLTAQIGSDNVAWSSLEQVCAHIEVQRWATRLTPTELLAFVRGLVEEHEPTDLAGRIRLLAIASADAQLQEPDQ